MQLSRTAFAILSLFNKSMTHYNKTYCWPTRSKIQKQLKDWFGISASLSWIDDNLGILKAGGYILSYRNYGTNADGTKFNKPSNRQLTAKAVKLLISHGIRVARRVFQKVSALWYANRHKTQHPKNTAKISGPEKTTLPKNPHTYRRPPPWSGTFQPITQDT